MRPVGVDVERRVEQLAGLISEQAKAAEVEFGAEMARIAWRSGAVLLVVMLALIVLVPLTLRVVTPVTAPPKLALPVTAREFVPPATVLLKVTLPVAAFKVVALSKVMASP